MPKVSVVIPCYNHGMYIDEAINSVLAQTYKDFEIIIINDGSTDEFTNKLLKKYDKPKTRVIYYQNEGTASARNKGIKRARGKYILPLDADDKIGEEYLEKAVKILDNNPKIGIVYCAAEFFGDRHGRWDAPEFSIDKILLENMIFCSALFKKSDWEKVGGYNTSMKDGYEDWDFWLSMLESGIGVHKIPEILFFYRIKRDSRNQQIMNQEEKKLKACLQIVKNHPKLYANNMESVIKRIESLSNTIIDYQRKIGSVKQKGFISWYIRRLLKKPI